MYTLSEAKKKYESYIETNKGNAGMTLSQYCETFMNVKYEDLYAFISLDVESDGLWGKPFAISVVCYNVFGKELEAHTWSLRNLDSVVKNEWVRENVLPVLDFKPYQNVVRHFDDSYEHMMKNFAEFWLQHKDENAIWHMGHVVEANLFKELHNMNYIGDFDAPYCPIEVSGFLKYLRYPADSVDGFANYWGIKVEGSTHDPLYDARIAAKVFFYICEERDGRGHYNS